MGGTAIAEIEVELLVRVTTKVVVHEGTTEAAAQAAFDKVVESIKDGVLDEFLTVPEVKVVKQEVYE